MNSPRNNSFRNLEHSPTIVVDAAAALGAHRRALPQQRPLSRLSRARGHGAGDLGAGGEHLAAEAVVSRPARHPCRCRSGRCRLHRALDAGPALLRRARRNHAGPRGHGQPVILSSAQSGLSGHAGERAGSGSSCSRRSPSSARSRTSSTCTSSRRTRARSEARARAPSRPRDEPLRARALPRATARRCCRCRARLAALYADKIHDAPVIDAVGDIERLTTNLSQKIWQKITLVETDLEDDRGARAVSAGELSQIPHSVKP